MVWEWNMFKGLRGGKRIPGFCLFVLVFVFAFGVPSAVSGEWPPLPSFDSSDRVLVLAPHPDDETLGAWGAIHRALHAGARVKVVLLTNGENNVLSFLAYKKQVFFKRKTLLEIGKFRKKETVQALIQDGLSESDAVFLGYPDFGTLKILTQHWGKTPPYRGVMSRWNRIPFEDAPSAGAPYSGENLLKDLKNVLTEFQPTKIFVSHPADEHRDHRALYLFTRIALWDLKDTLKPPRIYPYLVHLDGWPFPRGYDPERPQTLPLELLENDLSWQTLTLSPEEVKGKYRTIQEYPSQIPYAPDRLVSYARSPEFYGDYPEVPLPDGGGWQEIKNYNPLLLTRKTSQQKFISKVDYAREQGRLRVRVELKYLRNRGTGVSLVLLGYKQGVPFEAMPKIEIFSRLNFLSVKDKKKKISKKEVEVSTRGKELTFSLPLSMLGDPDFILSSVKTRRAWDLSIDETAWRVLSLES